MFLLKIKCSEIKVSHLPSEGAESGTKAIRHVHCVCCGSGDVVSVSIHCCAPVGHRGNPGSLTLFSDSIDLNQSWGSSIVYVINNHQGLHDWIFPHYYWHWLKLQLHTERSSAETFLHQREETRFTCYRASSCWRTAGKHDLNITFDPHSAFEIEHGPQWLLEKCVSNNEFPFRGSQRSEVNEELITRT